MRTVCSIWRIGAAVGLERVHTEDVLANLSFVWFFLARANTARAV